MNYQELLQKSMKRSNIKYLILYSILALICCGGALAGLNSDNTVQVMNLMPVSTRVTGTIFLALFVLMLILIVRTLRAAWSQKALNGLYREIREFGNPETVLSYVGKLPKSELCSHGDFRFDKKYVAFLLDDSVSLRPTHQLVWGYLKEEEKVADRRNRALSFQTQEPPVVVLVFESGRVLNLRARNRDSASRLLEEIRAVNPMMSIGFNEKNVTIYRKNPKNLRSASNLPQQQASGSEKENGRKKRP